MRVFANFVRLLLTLAGSLGCLVAIIWLIAVGQWKTLGLGIALSLVMPTVYMLVVIPAMGLAYLSTRANALVRAISGCLAATWTSASIGCWIIFCFAMLVYDESRGPLAARVLFAYNVILAPMVYMGRGSRGDPIAETREGIGLLAAVIAFTAQVTLWLSGAHVFWGVCAVGAVVLCDIVATMLIARQLQAGSGSDASPRPKQSRESKLSHAAQRQQG